MIAHVMLLDAWYRQPMKRWGLSQLLSVAHVQMCIKKRRLFPIPVGSTAKMSLLVYNTFSIAAFSSGDLNVAASLLYKSLNCFNASLDFVTVTRLSGTDKGMSCSIRACLYGHSTSSHSAEVDAVPEVKAVPHSAEVEAVPRSAEVEAEPCSAEVETEVEAVPRSAEVEAISHSAEVEAEPRSAEEEAVPRSAEEEAVPRSADVEAVPRSAEVEAEVEGALSRMLILAGPSAFILGSPPLCHKPTR